MRSDQPRPWTIGAGGVTLSVRLTPKGGRDAVDGIDTLADGRSVLKARVRVAPTDGEANEALRHLVAEVLGVPLRAVAISAGATSRIKRLAIAGDGASLAAALEKICAVR